VEGRDLAAAAHLSAHEIVTIAAEGLIRLHALSPATCSFDQRLDRRIDLARRRVEAGLVDEADFDDERQGQTARSVFADLLAQRPSDEDLVVTHGDATFENLIDGAVAFRASSTAGVSGWPIDTVIWL
jgi:aminoglycoside 3'-phosphotransferase II